MIPRLKNLDSLTTLMTLEHLPRTGWCQHGITSPESVAAHTLGVAHVALTLLPQVEPALDAGRVLAMTLVHDAAEALLGDFPLAASRLLPAGVKAQAEAEAAAEVLDGLSLDAFREYQAGESREARFARLCDKLQLGVRLLAYQRSGQRGLDEFEKGLHELDASEFAATEELRSQIIHALSLV